MGEIIISLISVYYPLCYSTLLRGFFHTLAPERAWPQKNSACLGIGAGASTSLKSRSAAEGFRKWRAICPACHVYGKGNLARHLHCLPNLPFKKFSQFVRQNAPACHITLIEWSCKNSSPYFGLFESSCHITYMRGFSENSSDKDETKQGCRVITT